MNEVIESATHFTIHRMQIYGNWNKKLTGVKIDQDGKKGEKVVLWRKSEELTDHGSNKWRIANFVQKQLEITPELEKLLPQTDSRLRNDRRCLEANDSEAAGFLFFFFFFLISFLLFNVTRTNTQRSYEQ